MSALKKITYESDVALETVITPNSGAGSKTATKQHEAEAVQQAKATATAGNRTSDFGDHAKTISVNWLDDVPGLAPVGSSVNQE